MVTKIDGVLLRAVPALAEHPLARRMHGLVLDPRSEQKGLGPTSISAAIPDCAFEGLLPAEDIMVLRGLQLDPSEGLCAEELRARLTYLEQIGAGLPRHIHTC